MKNLTAVVLCVLMVVVFALIHTPNSVTAQEPTGSPEALQGVVTANFSPVRGGPGADYPPVGVVRKDDAVRVVGRNQVGDWLYVTKDNLIGWVTAKFIAVSGDVLTLPVSTRVVGAKPSPEEPVSTPSPVPAPAQTGKGRIVLVSDINGQNDIYSMNLDGGDWKRLTRRRGYDPKYSPDGSSIAYDALTGGNWDVFVMKADGSDVVQLTTDPHADYSPDWSPDGSQLVFVSERDGWSNLYVMNADGASQRALIDTKDVAEESPAWSPDGDKILFGQMVDGDGDGKITDVATVIKDQDVLAIW
jgi:Tol biopolymer transport system component/uncharacterized protein YraI